MRRLLILLAVLTALCCTVAAYEVPEDFTGLTLEEAVADFMAANGLSEKNFAISYTNTVTGESYAFNDTWFSIAASTYKLPLNMYFYEMEQAGEITDDTVISWTGRTLSDIHYESIVNSNNELSEALMWYWGDHVTYKENLRKYFTMTDEEIDPLYWQANWFCVRMMMDCLKYLYENQDSFPELIGYMKQAMPGQYFKRGAPDYEVAHKYGAVQWFFNDVGIIYTPQPILLAVYTQHIYDDSICAAAAELVTAYTVWQGEQAPLEEDDLPEEPARRQELAVEQLPQEAPEEEPEEIPVTEPLSEPEPAEPEVVTPAEPEKKTSVLPLAAAGVAALLLLLAALRALRRR